MTFFFIVIISSDEDMLEDIYQKIIKYSKSKCIKKSMNLRYRNIFEKLLLNHQNEIDEIDLATHKKEVMREFSII